MRKRFRGSRWLATLGAAALAVAAPGAAGRDDARDARGRDARRTRPLAARTTRGAVQRLATGAVGLAPGQTARLNVADTCPRPPGGVRVRLLLVGDDGTPLARGERSLEAGKTVFLDLPRSNERPSSGRLSVRAVVELPDAPCDGDACPSLLATLEVVDDATGRTQLALTAERICLPSSEPGDPIRPIGP